MELSEEFLRSKGLQEVKLKGNEYWCLCPFHNEHTSSFSINKETGQWNCFGCGEHGGLNKLSVMLNLDFCKIDYTFKEKEIKLECLPESVLDGFTDRRYSVKWVETFGLNTLRRLEVKFDESKMRMVFPMRDIGGRLVSVVGRLSKMVVPDWQKKYKIISYNNIYKGILGIDKVCYEEEIIIVEGLRDWLILQKEGITNSVCLGGTVLTNNMLEKQLKPLALGSKLKRLVIGLDNDDAGEKGYQEICNQLLEARLFKENEIFKVSPKGVKDWMKMYEDGLNIKISLSEREGFKRIVQKNTSSSSLEYFKYILPYRKKEVYNKFKKY